MKEMVDKEKIEKKIDSLNALDEFYVILDELRIICANEKSQLCLRIVEKAIKKSDSFDDKKLICFLYDLKIRQLYHSKNNFPLIKSLMEDMKKISFCNNYYDVLALIHQLQWYIEKFDGNVQASSITIRNAMNLLERHMIQDEYIIFGCKYSYALDKWLVKREFSSSGLLEECFSYFLSKGYIHGLVMSLGILIIIYQQTQNKEESMKLVQRIINKKLLHSIPREIMSIIHFFIGFSHELSFNLNEAEKHLLGSQTILKPIYKKSIYSGYYITALSHLTAIYALQGKLELALKQMKEVEELIEEGFATKNLDSFNKKQIIHTFNLTRFYIKSRLLGFQIEAEQDLIRAIINNTEKYHSNAIMFSEFLLNADLTKGQLIRIRNFDNPSTKRVEHIINFLVEKTIHTEEQQVLRYTSILQKRPVEERMTYVEKALADLLAAREYYKIKRFAEIYPLLKKYENQLHRVEVLESRIFMEAFIQVGAHKNGDPLGPALQYMAIKKCRHYGFSRLENKLLDYLDKQYKYILSFNK